MALLVTVRRAWRNLVRAPGRSLLLIGVLGAIVAMSITCLAIKAGAEMGLADAKMAMGNEVQLVPDVTAARQAALAGQAFSLSPVPQSLVDSLSQSEYVVATDLQVTEMLSSPDLTMVQEEEPTGALGGFFRAVRPEMLDGFQVVGNSLPNSILDQDGAGSREIVAGRLYTDEEVASGAAVAVVDETLADQNGLEPGSTFTLQTSDGTISKQFTVVGVTRDLSADMEQTIDQQGLRGLRFRLFGAANQISTPYTALTDLRGGDDTVSRASFYLDAPDHVDAFISQASTLGLESSGYRLTADPSSQLAAAPFQSLEGLARVAVIALIIVGAVIVILLMSIVTRERKLEIGVLRALGVSRRGVAAQFIVETVTVCLVALVIGGLVGGFASQAAAEKLLAREVQAVDQRPIGRGAFLPGGISIIEPPQNAIGAQTTPEIEVGFGWQEVSAALGITLLLAMAGSLASAFWSMKMEPASILTSRT